MRVIRLLESTLGPNVPTSGSRGWMPALTRSPFGMGFGSGGEWIVRTDHKGTGFISVSCPAHGAGNGALEGLESGLSVTPAASMDWRVWRCLVMKVTDSCQWPLHRMLLIYRIAQRVLEMLPSAAFTAVIYSARVGTVRSCGLTSACQTHRRSEGMRRKKSPSSH